MSSQPPSTPALGTGTTPGPPVPARGTSTKLNANRISNPFQVDLVLPFSIALGKVAKLTGQQQIKQGYEDLLRALEGEGGLKIASRVGTGTHKDEVWVFVGAGEEKISELVDRERSVYFLDTSLYTVLVSLNPLFI